MLYEKRMERRAVIFFGVYNLIYEHLRFYSSFFRVLIAESNEVLPPDEYDGVFDSVHRVSSWDAIDEVCDVLDTIVPDHEIFAVCTALETQVELGGMLRARYSVAGVSSDVTTLCRDKIQMKSLIAGLGIPTANYMHVSSLETLYEASRVVGFPMVLKPVSGFGIKRTVVHMEFFSDGERLFFW